MADNAIIAAAADDVAAAAAAAAAGDDGPLLFRAARERYLTPLLDRGRVVRIDGVEDFFDLYDADDLEEAQDMFYVYQPRENDMSNVMLFGNSLASLKERKDMGSNRFVFLILPSGGLALMYLEDHGLDCDGVSNGFFLGETRYRGANMAMTLETTSYTIGLDMLLPVTEVDIPDNCKAIFATGFWIMTNLVVPFDGSATLYIYGKISLTLADEDAECFSVVAFRSGLENFPVEKLSLTLRGMRMSDEYWSVLKDMPLKLLDIFGMDVPEEFWHKTRAVEVTAGSYLEAGLETALVGLGSRTTRIDKVNLDWEVSCGTVAEVDVLLQALQGVNHLFLHSIVGISHTTWSHFWLSPALQHNDTLLSLEVYSIRLNNRPYGVWFARAIGQCLQINSFLETIDIPKACMTADANAYWQAHVEPRLDLNRQHFWDVDADESRLSVLHDKVVRLRKYPSRLYKLVRGKPMATTRRFNPNRLGSLENQNVMLQRHNAAQQHQLGEMQQQLDEMQQQINALLARMDAIGGGAGNGNASPL